MVEEVPIFVCLLPTYLWFTLSLEILPVELRHILRRRPDIYALREYLSACPSSPVNVAVLLVGRRGRWIGVSMLAVRLTYPIELLRRVWVRKGIEVIDPSSMVVCVPVVTAT